MNSLTAKGQTWSMDLLVALVVFLSMFIGFYALLLRSSPTPLGEALHIDAETIAQSITQDKSSFIEAGHIRSNEFRRLALGDFDEVKRDIGAKHNFCIYLEDSEGNLIAVEDSIGIGNGQAVVGGRQCGHE